MAQVNVAVEDRVLAALDRVAQAKSLSRPELLRKAIQELIEAHDAGRTTFQNEAAPRLDATVSGLVHQLRELVMELDRAQADNARMLGKLTEKWNGGEEANRIAQEKLLAHFREQDQASLSPFYARAEQLLSAFEDLEPTLIAALEPHLVKISAQLDKSIALASEPRQMGYETTPARNAIDGAFEIKGVTREAVEAFSSRRAEILAELAKEDRGSARERELAALSTRRGKELEPDAARQVAAWKETARAIGFLFAILLIAVPVWHVSRLELRAAPAWMIRAALATATDNERAFLFERLLQLATSEWRHDPITSGVLFDLFKEARLGFGDRVRGKRERLLADREKQVDLLRNLASFASSDFL